MLAGAVLPAWGADGAVKALSAPEMTGGMPLMQAIAQRQSRRDFDPEKAIDEQTLRSYIMRTDDIATDMGTVIDGAEALKIGLVDGIGSLSDAYTELKKLVDIKRAKV